MKNLIALVCFFLPHPLNRLFRSLIGQNIGPKSKIHIFSFILANEFSIGERSVIAPFTILKCNRIKIGNDVQISPFTVINSALIKGADFEIGNFSRVFPLCWIEPGEGIKIGEHTGIGGHTLIFTHGAWSNYLSGGPAEYGPVVIEDNVWLPWRVFIMPSVTIGKNCIIGANSTVTKSIPPFSLAAGSPAKVIKENINTGLDQEAFTKRCEAIMKSYNEYCLRSSKHPYFSNLNITISDSTNSWGSGKEMVIDLNKSTYKSKNHEATFFVSFLRRYGVRLRPCL